MGGWASYKLAFEHPDDFAGALVLDGPVACGVEVYPGATGPASQDPACAEDGQSAQMVANARWIPYVIDQTYADELVPTTGVIAQAQAFDQAAQRYDLFIHTGADHLAFATEDRFSDAVAALGSPVRTTQPGAFTYAWYPEPLQHRAGDRRHRGLLAERAGGARRVGGHDRQDRRRRRRAARTRGQRRALRAVARHSAVAGDEHVAQLEARQRAPRRRPG